MAGTKQDPNIPNQFNGNISFTKPNLANFKANFWWVGHGANHTAGEPGYEPAWSEYSNNLVTVLALIFTSTCGVMEGANLSGDLKDPAKSLPKGTLMAKCTSFTTYIIFTTLLASCFDRDALQCEYLILQKAAVSPTFVVVGIAMACLSTSLGALFGAARIMQAIARDGLFPIPYFAKGTKEGDEPRRALIFTYVFANIFAYFGNNSVAGLGDILTDFFLTASIPPPSPARGVVKVHDTAFAKTRAK
jgi:amino acid transporter